MLPLLVLLLAIGSGRGRSPARRTPVAWSSCSRTGAAARGGAREGLAVASEVLLVCAAAGLAMLVLDPLVGLDLSAGRIAPPAGSRRSAYTTDGSRWAGAATSSRALAIGVPAGLAAAGYLVNGLHSMAGWLDPFRFVSPFWLVGSSPLQGGADGWDSSSSRWRSSCWPWGRSSSSAATSRRPELGESLELADRLHDVVDHERSDEAAVVLEPHQLDLLAQVDRVPVPEQRAERPLRVDSRGRGHCSSACQYAALFTCPKTSRSTPGEARAPGRPLRRMRSRGRDSGPAASHRS